MEAWKPPSEFEVINIYRSEVESYLDEHHGKNVRFFSDTFPISNKRGYVSMDSFLRDYANAFYTNNTDMSFVFVVFILTRKFNIIDVINEVINNHLPRHLRRMFLKKLMVLFIKYHNHGDGHAAFIVQKYRRYLSLKCHIECWCDVLFREREFLLGVEQGPLIKTYSEEYIWRDMVLYDVGYWCWLDVTEEWKNDVIEAGKKQDENMIRLLVTKINK